MRIVPLIRSSLLALAIVAASVASFAQIGISVSFGPPALPVYEQPPCPAEGYLWTPGYWAYAENGGYYWVPGTWVMAPQPGLLWTPPYWGWQGGRYAFYEGYWGLHVGFYGGISYGFGYFGEGYQGGRWDNGHFFYNRSVNNVNVTNIHNVYDTRVINNTTVSRVSYNGGQGGVEARPTAEQESIAHERHVAPVEAQNQHVEAARSNPELRASANQGKPPIAATAKPGTFNEREAVPAKEAGAPYHAEANGGAEEQKAGASTARPENNVSKPPATGGEEPKADTAVGHPENYVPKPPAATHAKDLQPHPRPAPPNTGNAKADQKYQQQQDKLYAQQNRDHQKLQQKQEQDHQRVAQQNADEAKKQQVEQKHQQQTQKMEQKHTTQQQQMQAKQEPANHAAEPPREGH
jgi:hypothetical protein